MRTKGLGYLPDLPSIRDLTVESKDVASSRLLAVGEPSVRKMLREIGAERTVDTIPGLVDLRKWCTPVEDQGNIGSCTSQAAAALLEYFEFRSFGCHVDASRLFIYKNSRRIAGLTGDSGSYLRSTMEAITAFGAPPEEYHPYNVAEFDKEPDVFCYAYAQNYKAVSYYRLDPSGVYGAVLLSRIKTNLAAGLPSMFGFTVYSSYEQADSNGGRIPFPAARDRIVGGHAVVAVGYDDGLEIRNTSTGSVTTGALLIRNSWGTGWGEAGYGWLPYTYVLRGLADDWWSLLKSSWVNTGVFSLDE